jgi:hypothetical protein
MFIVGGQDGVSSLPIDFDDHWRLIVVTEGDFWVYDFTDQQWDNDGEGLVGALGTLFLDSDGLFVFGQDDGGTRPLGLDIAAAAVWPTEVSGANIKSLVAVDELRRWADVDDGQIQLKTPVAAWMFGQTNISTEVEDITGNGADQTSRSGTRVLLEPPPITYGRDVETVTVKEGTPPPSTGQLVPRGM